MNNIYNKITIPQTLLLFITLINCQSTFAQTLLNDGRIRLRVWTHKVWTNANCDDPGNQEYVYRGIRVRPRNDATGLGWTPYGLNIRADGAENRWWSRTEWAGLQTPAGTATFPMTQDANGVLMMDVTYPSSQVPTAFDWSISEMFENDDNGCPWPCNDGGDAWTYDPSMCCGALGDDNYVGYSEDLAINYFRGAPAGQVHYVQTDVLGPSSFLAEQQSYAILFAFQWDWVDPLDPLPNVSTNQSSGGIEYQDGPLQLDVQLMGVFSDSDYDWGANCVFGVAGAEDLRIKWRARDNLAAFSGASTCINTLGQEWPQWNTGNPVTNLLTRNYTTAQTNFKQFEVEFELWEEDCNADCTYDASGCVLGIGADDAYYFGTTGLINWRNSIPTTTANPSYWNYLDVPVRAGSGSFNNWTVWLRYRWHTSRTHSCRGWSL
jgi:hypothetical protein